MLTVYYSNLLEIQKDILLHLMNSDPLDDPFQAEIVLVQSPGMAQWLQWQIAEQKGISANFQFPMPASFIWQLYRDNLDNVAQQNQFSKEQLVWRLMKLIPQYLSHKSFSSLHQYLFSAPQSTQQKLYQLSDKIADLFDQYLVYRPEWIFAWEEGNDQKIYQQITSQNRDIQSQLDSQIEKDIEWQGILWRALIDEINKDNQGVKALHRAHLHQQFLQVLIQKLPVKLPKRIFVFGISALPKAHLETLNRISEFCDVHLFFTNPCREYWADIIDLNYWQKLQLRQRINYQEQTKISLFSSFQIDQINNHYQEYSVEQELLQVGHPLLSSWGKQGRDFLYLLTDLQSNEINAYVDLVENNLLSQIQRRILTLAPTGSQLLHFQEQDRSFSIQSCYSAMREVEVLQDYLLSLFNQDRSLTPKDVVVMVADIDKYTPYIQAVFGQSEHYIPFSISDNKLSENDVIVSTFIKLLNLKECLFSAQDVLDFLDIPSVRSRFHIQFDDLPYIRHWAEETGIRFGLEKYSDTQEENYNAWKSGLERMLLGYAMREENGIWQDSLGFDNSSGLKGELVGYLAEFIEQLYQWHKILCAEWKREEWKSFLFEMVDRFFLFDEETQETQWYLKDCIEHFVNLLENTHFSQPLCSEVVAEVMENVLQDSPNNLRFLVGKVNFCTLLPMRSIPFKVVCLLGMNEGEYPRQEMPNSFDLMQYHRQKGDRFKRDDDRYLFLEALISAQNYFYLSYIGRSLIDDEIKEPSVLVNQLLDYIVENLETDKDITSDNRNDYWRKRLVTHHSMTAFSEKNFQEKYRTFSTKWLPLVNKKSSQEQPFIQPLNNSTVIKEIELSQLIRFVQHPVKFFLEQVLGISLKVEEQILAETENFSLNNLDLYLINQEVLSLPEEDLQAFFSKLRIKGIMPRGNFGRVYEEKIRQDITGIKTLVGEYLHKESHSVGVMLNFTLATQTVDLTGVINQLYFLENTGLERVTWRVGSAIRDSDLIEAWIYYLVLCATQDKTVVAHTYAKNEQIQFKTLEKSTAIVQLQSYLEAYIQAQRSACLVLTRGIKEYFKLLQCDTEQYKIRENCLRALEKQIYGDSFYHGGDLYWQRILTSKELENFDFEIMNRNMKDWFGLMLECIQ